MDLPPPSPTLLTTVVLTCLGTSPGWAEDVPAPGSLEAVPEPAISILGLLGLCLILLRRAKP